MREVFAKALLVGGALCVAAGSIAEAGFHHRSVGTYPCAVITPSPSIYGPGYAVAPCPPNPVPHGCWLARHLGWGCRHSYHGHCGGNACGSDGCDSCGTGNCDTDGATSDGPGNTASDRVMNEKVLSDRPVGSEPAGEPAPEPVPDKSTSHARGSAFRLTGMKQDRPGQVEFNKGVASYRARELNEALAAFEAAIAAEPEVAVYHYYLAMTLFGLSGAEAGQEALGRAVELEQREPITDWGKRMQREQGRARAWVEKARRDAGIVK